MPVSPEQLAAIVAAVGDPTEPGLSARLRETHRGLLFTVCSEDDVGDVPPVAQAPGFNLYYVSGAEHCLRLTGDGDDAIGVVIGWTEDEESL